MTTEQLKELVQQPGIRDDAAVMAIEEMVFDTEQIEKGHEVVTHAIALKDGKREVIFTQFSDRYDGADKDAFAEMVNEARRDCDAVLFVSEVWFVEYHGKEAPDMDEVLKVRPSCDPNRKEGLIVHLYTPGRALAFLADIHRNPSQLGDWRLMSDSDKDGIAMQGRFA